MKRRAGNKPLNPWVRRVRVGYGVAKTAWNAYKGYKKVTGSSRKVYEPAPLTTQNDFSTQYRRRRRRRSRYQRKGKRFSRAVHRTLNRALGSRIFVRSQTGSVNWLAGGGTIWSLFNGILNQSGSRELTVAQIRSGLYPGNVSLRSTTRMLLQSVCLDVSLTARSTNTTPVDVDVYVLYCRKIVDNGGLGSGVDNFAASETVLPNTNSGYIPVTDAGAAVGRLPTNMASGSIGWTPWASPNFCSFFTVSSKRKILLTPGSTTHLQLKKYYNKMITLEECSKFDAKPGITFGYLFQVNSTYNGVSQPAGNIDFNWEQFYNVKALRDSEDTVVVT